MTRYYRIIGLVALCFFLAGCSGYRQASWHTPGQVPEEEESGDRGELQVGDKVRVTLVTGEKVEGEFVSSSADSIDVLVVTSQYAEAGTGREIEEGVRTYPWRDITSFENFGVKPITTVGAILFTAVIVGVVVYSISQWSMNF